MTESQIANIGIGRKFQRPTVFETLSVFENMELALKTAKGPFASVRARLDSEQLDRIEQTLIQVNLRDAVWRTAGILSHGQKQWLEIGMLLVQQPRLILLDEPVAGMTDAETDRTAELCLSLEGSHSLVVVEHDMEFVEQDRPQGYRPARGLGAGRGTDGPGAQRPAGDRGLSRPLRQAESNERRQVGARDQPRQHLPGPADAKSRQTQC